MQKICLWCHKPFESKQTTSLYCRPSHKVRMFEYRKKRGHKIKEVFGFVYILESDSGLYKIGITSNSNVALRITQIAMDTFGKFGRVGLYKSFQIENIREVEKYLHEKYNNKRKSGEWFSLSNDDILEIETCLTKRAPDRLWRGHVEVIPLQPSLFADDQPATYGVR